MKLFALCLSCSFLISTVYSQEALISQLFEAREPAAFEAMYAKAEKEGAPKQALVEARFLYLVDSGDDAALANYSTTLEAHLPDLRMDESVIFSVPEDYRAIVEYTRALSALQKGAKDQFKKHITEAFWLSPSQATVFGRHIDQVRLEGAMKELKFDFTRKLKNQKDGKELPLKSHLGDAPAILLHFWSPWARESLDSMPDFLTMANELKKHKIPATSVLLTGNEESKQAADEFLKEQKDSTTASLWLQDDQKGTLASLLRVKAFPTVILLSKDGSVLFNGHPIETKFWSVLKKIEPKITRPDAAKTLGE